ncbi:MAG: ABC transporter permease, partial [Microbacterium sp.]|nr:ABC transporter permease [Microbacterium sp.]
IANGVAMAASARMFVAAAAYYLFIWAFGLVFSIPTVPEPATAWLTIPIGILVGLSFGLPIMAYAASIEDDRGQFALIQRFLFMPMFLFSGTFYPLTTLPIWLQWIGWISPLWHATELGRIVSYGSAADAPLLWLHLGYLVLLAAVGYAFVRRAFSSRLAK